MWCYVFFIIINLSPPEIIIWKPSDFLRFLFYDFITIHKLFDVSNDQLSFFSFMKLHWIQFLWFGSVSMLILALYHRCVHPSLDLFILQYFNLFKIWLNVRKLFRTVLPYYFPYPLLFPSLITLQVLGLPSALWYHPTGKKTLSEEELQADFSSSSAPGVLYCWKSGKLGRHVKNVPHQRHADPLPQGKQRFLHSMVYRFKTLPWSRAYSQRILHEDPTAHIDNIHKRIC